MGNGILTKGATLGYNATTAGTYTVLADLQSIGEIGGDSETVETTRLSNSKHTYIKGLGNFSSLECKFLYNNTDATDSFRKLKDLDTAGTTAYWQITLPDTTAITFQAQVHVKLGAMEVNGVLTFTAALIISSDITWTDPAAV